MLSTIGTGTEVISSPPPPNRFTDSTDDDGDAVSDHECGLEPHSTECTSTADEPLTDAGENVTPAPLGSDVDDSFEEPVDVRSTARVMNGFCRANTGRKTRNAHASSRRARTGLPHETLMHETLMHETLMNETLMHEPK
jgi:hypothetical protein